MNARVAPSSYPWRRGRWPSPRRPPGSSPTPLSASTPDGPTPARCAEVSALEWRDVSDARDGDGVLITVRTSKTNQEGDTADVRYLKNGAANAIRTLRAADAAPTDRVIGLSPLQIQRRFTAAARAAGIEARVTAHSGRVGLASELTARGASTTEVMLAGNWKTARMVAHYSAGATAERGAVQKYL